MSTAWIPVFGPVLIFLPLSVATAAAVRRIGIPPSARMCLYLAGLGMAWLVAYLVTYQVAAALDFRFGGRAVPFKVPFYLVSLAILTLIGPRLGRQLIEYRTIPHGHA